MPKILRTALVEYSAGQMYGLVKDIERYPAFLDWCNYAVIESSAAEFGSPQDSEVVATVGVVYKGIDRRFTTRNTHTGNDSEGFSIDMELVEGPFSKLNGRWVFIALGTSASKVVLDIDFEIKNILMRPVLTSTFSEIADRLVDAFASRANSVYG